MRPPSGGLFLRNRLAADFSMQTAGSIGRSLYRLVFRRGSPQRIQYSPHLTIGALLALVLLAVAVRRWVFGGDVLAVVLYLFTVLAGLYLGAALASRRIARSRSRVALQAALLVLGAAHLLVLLAAPLSGLVPVRWVALAAALAALAGLGSCTRFALGTTGSKAYAWTLLFLFAAAGFYATMEALLAIALA